MLGGVFGARENAPTYIAGVASLLLLALFAAVLFAPVPHELDRRETLQTVGGFFLAAIGYLFGSVSGKSG